MNDITRICGQLSSLKPSIEELVTLASAPPIHASRAASASTALLTLAAPAMVNLTSNSEEKLPDGKKRAAVYESAREPKLMRTPKSDSCLKKPAK